jgi:hypothetical protein
VLLLTSNNKISSKGKCFENSGNKEGTPYSSRYTIYLLKRLDISSLQIDVDYMYDFYEIRNFSPDYIIYIIAEWNIDAVVYN